MQAGRTIAVDPKVIPLGTRIKLNGKEYIAEDTGLAIKGRRVDLLVENHEKAMKWGKKSIEVYVEN